MVEEIQRDVGAPDQLKELEWCLVIELDHAQVTHEGRSVQTVNDDLDLGSIKIRRFVEHLCLIASIHIVSTYRIKHGLKSAG